MKLLWQIWILNLNNGFLLFDGVSLKHIRLDPALFITKFVSLYFLPFFSQMSFFSSFFFSSFFVQSDFFSSFFSDFLPPLLSGCF